jgi:predicted secreted protein
MTQNVAQAGTGLRAVSAALLVAALGAAPAAAGDRALIDFIGYSEDGRYFAFEEFGLQDGSGFPYSTIYVVDLPAHKWVSGSPYRITLETEDADVSDARDAAFELAEPKLDELEIDEPAFVIAVNGDGEPTPELPPPAINPGDGQALTFGRPGYGLGEVIEPRTLLLETYHLDSPEDCEAFMGEEAFGFALILEGDEIYRDEGPLPASRGCPHGYKIYAVVSPAEWSLAQGAGLVAIISNYPHGFEGPDRRFLAVPLPQ